MLDGRVLGLQVTNKRGARMRMKLEEEWGSNSEPRKNATNGSYFLPAPLGITFFCLPPMLFTERNRSSPSFIGTAPRLRSCLR